MAEEIILGIKLDTSGAKQPIAELEDSLRRMREEISTLPSDSAAFKKVASEIRKVDAELKNVNKGLEGLSKDKISESLGKIVGGAGAAVAGFGLLSQAFGATKESAEEMQKAFNTAFGAINAVKGMVELFQGLGAILPTVTAAFKTLDTAMKFSVIGLIALAVAGLVYALGNLTDAEEQAETATDRYNKKLEEQNKRIKDLKVELEKLTEVQTNYVNSIENVTEAQVNHKKNLEELNTLSSAYSNIANVQLLTDEKLLDVSNKIESVNSKINQGLLEKFENFSRLSQLATKRKEELDDEIEATENLLAATDKYFTYQVRTADGFEYRTTESNEYKNIAKQLKFLNDERTTANFNIENAENSTRDLLVQLNAENSTIEKLRGNILSVTQARGLSTEAIEKQKEAEEKLRQEQEKARDLQRAINDQLAEYELIRKKNIIRTETEIKLLENSNKIQEQLVIASTKYKEIQEQINADLELSSDERNKLLLDNFKNFIGQTNSIYNQYSKELVEGEERRNIELLEREHEFSKAKLEISRSEILNAKQKADALLVIEQEYKIDIVDINKKYDEEILANREKANEDRRAKEKEANENYLDLKKRNLLAESEAEFIQSKKDLDAQIEWMHAQRDAELMNTKLTAEEKYLIKLRWKEKEDALIKEQANKEHQTRVELNQEIVNLYAQLSSAIGAIMQASLEGFQRRQAEELEAFNQTKDSEYAALEAYSEDDIVLKENLEAERKRIEQEKLLFELEQANRLKEKQKKQAGFELGLLLGQSIANIAAAILKAQVNPGFPLSIAEIVRISALGLTQVGAITAQMSKINSFRDGGVISGPSHEGGGVKFAVGGQVNELEGGEGVINKRSMAMPQVAAAASYLNQLGGGVAFDTSSVKNSNIATLSAMMSRGESSLVRAYVVESDISDKQKLNEKIRNKAKF